MDDRTIGSIVRFLAQETGAAPASMTAQTNLVEDLGIDGMDGIELMQKFAEDFRVDLSGFEPARYFGPESGPNVINAVLTLLRRERHQPLRRLTVADLARAAMSGVWVDQAG